MHDTINTMQNRMALNYLLIEEIEGVGGLYARNINIRIVAYFK